VEESAPPVPAEASTADDASPLEPAPAGVVAAAVDLSKYPSSTVQILGAEKALFRALKQRQGADAPKFGLLFDHTPQPAGSGGDGTHTNKGRISRVLAAKMALSARVGAVEGPAGSADHAAMSASHAAVEERLKALEEQLSPANGPTEEP